MNSKDIGNLGEHIAIVEFLKRDIQVSRPLGDNSRYDLLLDIEETIFTCQVKSTNSASCELAEFYLTSSQAHRGKSRHKYDVDLFCCVDIKNNMVFIVPNTSDRSTIKIRYGNTLRGQTANINRAEDYTIDKFLDSI